jgi:hypothetical protein
VAEAIAERVSPRREAKPRIERKPLPGHLKNHRRVIRERVVKDGMDTHAILSESGDSKWAWN